MLSGKVAEVYRYIQKLLGHKSPRTTEIYTHISPRSITQVRSPIDGLLD